MEIERIRAAIPALSRCIYLNTGTFGPLPAPVAEEIRRVYGQIEEVGTFSPPIFWEMELAGFEGVRAGVARLMGADPAEIVLTRNVTDGINIVLHGLDWRAGDEVILTDQEHPSGTVPWLALAERREVRLRWLELVPDAREIVARFRALLSSRTRLACFSHVSCLTGLRLPVAHLCAVAREAGVLSLVDGAHGEGQFAVDVRGLSCDFYAGCGHKWLLGPQGVGMLFIQRRQVPHLRPIWLGWDVNQPFDRVNRRYQLQDTAARFEQSTRPWPLYLAFGKAIDFVVDVGLTAIEARVSTLRSQFLAGLQAIPGLTVLSPMEPALATGLVTARVPGWDNEALSWHLWESQRIVTNIIREYNALRFSLAFFTTERELEEALVGLEDASRRGQPR